MFLALALGVVLGSGLLSNTLLSGLRSEKQDLANQINALTDQRNALNEKLGAANEFDTQMSGRIVRDALAGKTVVLFRTPDADERKARLTKCSLSRYVGAFDLVETRIDITQIACDHAR